MINLIGTLQDIQKKEGYLSKESLKKLSEKEKIPLSRIFSVATFFASFLLTPPAKHTILVCSGTACYVRGSSKIVETISELLNIAPGKTTSDSKFRLETVNCLGACALGPLIVIDGNYHGNITPDKIRKVLEQYK